MYDIRIKNEELIRDLVGSRKEFPRYTTQLMNLANQNAQGTRPRVVLRNRIRGPEYWKTPKEKIRQGPHKTVL